MLNRYLQDIEFAYPELLFLLLLVPILGGWYISRVNRQAASLRVSSLQRFHNTASWKRTFRHFGLVFRLLAIACLILALARPQTYNDIKKAEGEGVDIVLCIDVSGSMLAQDFKPNRLEAAKEVAAEFVSNRPTDVSDWSFLLERVSPNALLLQIMKCYAHRFMESRGGFMVDGTAIGSGLATSLDRLRSSQSKSKVVILLTDGENNGGLIDPKTAKEMAKTLGIKVYTIGIGSEGTGTHTGANPGRRDHHATGKSQH